MHACEHFGVETRFCLRLRHAHVDRTDCRIDFPFLATPGDKQCHLPDIGLGDEMLAPVTCNRHALDEFPSNKLLQGIGNVRARDSKFLGDLLRIQWACAEIQEGVDLGHGSVDAPLASHVPPIEDEL